MAKIKHKSVKFSPEELAYELPAELDIKKLRRVGSGVETVKRMADRSKRTIGLDCAEPRHVHVVRAHLKLKVWLDPVSAGKNEGFKPVEVRKIVRLVKESRTFLIGKWNEFCNG